jgi:hypothetical protein
MRILGLTLIATLIGTAPAGAQVRADPGVVIGSRIAVRVNVTLTDDETPYYPVRGLTVSFARAAADTVFGRTDEAGVVTVLLTPGEYTVASTRPYAWKGVAYSWTVPVTVRADMAAVDFSRTNARTGGQVVRAGAPRQVQSTGDVSSPATAAGVSSGEGAVRWLSMEVGGEGGLTRAGDGSGSDAGYGGSGSFVGGLGPVALALGYRYTRIQFGGDLDPGSMRSGTAELRYHLRPGSAPIRPYIGALAGVGRWYGSETLGDESASMKMFGGSIGAQFGLATSVRLLVSATAAGTNIKTPAGTTNTGLFATGHIGLTFDIFSPAR